MPTQQQINKIKKLMDEMLDLAGDYRIPILVGMVLNFDKARDHEEPIHFASTSNTAQKNTLSVIAGILHDEYDTGVKAILRDDNGNPIPNNASIKGVSIKPSTN